MTQRHTMFVREDYEHGYIALVRDQYHAEVTQVNSRSIKYIQQVARGYNATIFLKGFVMRIFKLKDIPNREGFKFIGVTHNWERINCEVKQDLKGCFCIRDENGNSPFVKLKGWHHVLL